MAQAINMPYDLLQFSFAIIGALAVLAAISALFFAVDKGPKKLFTNNPLPRVGSREFLAALSQTVNVPIEKGGTITPLNNGEGFFTELLKEIAAAERNINFTVYIWEDGKISGQILDALMAKQKQGVEVRVLIDAIGGKNSPDQKFSKLMAAGGKVQKFRTFRFGKLTRFHRRNHRRAIVIDGKVGFTGGMAVKDAWIGNASGPDQWRDMMFKVTGPMARSLQSAFSDLWTSSTGEILLGLGIAPVDLPDEGNINFIHLVSSPTHDSFPLPKFLLMPMMAAQRTLYITTPYFIPDNHLLQTLIDRAKAGVDVRLMLPNELIDNKIARWNAQNYYQYLMEWGVKIYEYQPAFIHSKFFVVDGQFTVIGSPNLNFRSRNLDEENAFGIQDEAFAQKMGQTFLEDQKLCQEVSRRKWKKRALLLRFMSTISRLIEEQS
jgi:cardiolipin synthase A/B